MTTRTRPSDTEREEQVANLIEWRWKCEVIRHGYLDPLDFWLVRSGRTVGVAELKNRTVPSTAYADVFLSRHKWERLHLAAQAHDIEGLFIVAFTDGVYFINEKNIDPRKHTIGGRTDREDAPNDWEMLILVPVAEMKRIREEGS